MSQIRDHANAISYQSANGFPNLIDVPFITSSYRTWASLLKSINYPGYSLFVISFPSYCRESSHFLPVQPKLSRALVRPADGGRWTGARKTFSDTNFCSPLNPSPPSLVPPFGGARENANQSTVAGAYWLVVCIDAASHTAHRAPRLLCRTRDGIIVTKDK